VARHGLVDERHLWCVGIVLGRQQTALDQGLTDGLEVIGIYEHGIDKRRNFAGRPPFDDEP